MKHQICRWRAPGRNEGELPAALQAAGQVLDDRLHLPRRRGPRRARWHGY